MNATKGFLAKKSWYTVACTQIQVPSPDGGVINTQRDDGHQRTYKLVCAFYTLTTSIWKGRNDKLHRRDHELVAIQRTVVDAEIARVHRTPENLPALDQHYCNHPLDVILRKPPTYKRRWLHRVRTAIERKKQTRTNNTASQKNFMELARIIRTEQPHQIPQIQLLLASSRQTNVDP